MTELALEMGRAKRGATEGFDTASVLRERLEAAGSVVPSDWATECVREGVLGTTLGVGGCIDDRWPGFGVRVVVIEREKDP